MSSSPIAVIGAGIIGTTLAFELQRRGVATVLVDRDEPGRGASFGNMASIAVTEFLPASRPSVWRQLPGWLLDPAGPVRLRPSYLPRLTPWLLRFLAAGRPARVREIEAAGATLCARALDDLQVLLAAAGIHNVLSEQGCLCLYADDDELRQDREHVAALERHGVDHRLLDRAALRALEPALSPRIARAILFPQNRTVQDPFRLVQSFNDAYSSHGGAFVSGEVVGFDHDADGICGLRLDGGRSLQVAGAVLCAGAYTARLSGLLGEPIPLETERGYHTQITAPGVTLSHSLIWPARAFMVSPTANGIRVGGTVEMAGLNAEPDFRRAKAIVGHAQEALPGLEVSDATEWMGHRPALPDTLPIIGPSATAKGIWYATGHGHLGLTYAATTARLLGEIIATGQAPIDMGPYRVDRY